MSNLPLAWELTIGLVSGLLLFDYFFHIRKPHIPSLAESARWSAAYVGVALLFGAAVWVLGGPDKGVEYFAGYVTEKALSIDNVFVFLVIMAAFRVPAQDQQKALLIGIVFSLAARTGFIFLGAALIERFAWVFYVFGLVLVMTAGRLLQPQERRHASDPGEGLVVRLVRIFVPTTDEFDGDKLTTLRDGRRMATPMALVILTLGATDILFALDSIPAIFGLTEDVFIVFTATAFSLLGLRQLFFLINGLLERLLYLSYGLAAVLGFIGIKLVLHALHENNVPFINDGMPVNVVEISTRHSLFVILAILGITIAVSLFSPKGKAKTVVTALRQNLAEYIALNASSAHEEADAVYERLVEAERKVGALDPALKRFIRQPAALQAELAKAHELHAQRPEASKSAAQSGMTGSTSVAS
jgi:tellurite resistance protein TerC